MENAKRVSELSVSCPAPSASDRTLAKERAKALFLQGMPRREILEILAPLGVTPDAYDKWLQRGKWSVLRLSLSATTKPRPGSLPLRERLAYKAEKLFDSIPEVCPKTPRAFKDVMAGLAHATSAGNLLEGWSDRIEQHVAIDLLNADPLEMVVKPVELPAETIDPVPVTIPAAERT